MARRKKRFGAVTGKGKHWPAGRHERTFSVEVRVSRWIREKNRYNATACIKKRGSDRGAVSRCGQGVGAKSATAAVRAALTHMIRRLK